MKRGDMVRITVSPHIFLYPFWGSKDLGFPGECGRFWEDEIGLILDSYIPQGGNGARVLTSRGSVGWVNVYFIKALL